MKKIYTYLISSASSGRAGTSLVLFTQVLEPHLYVVPLAVSARIRENGKINFRFYPNTYHIIGISFG